MIKYDHLIGLQFEYGVQDCYSIVRSFYADNFGLLFPNYARPNEFWKHGLELYRDRYHKNGFRPLDVHPSEYQAGDLILMSIQSPVANHAGILLDNGYILHHLVGRLSTAEPYKGLTRNTTVAILRHKDIVLPENEHTGSILDILSPQMRRKISEQLEAHQSSQ